MPKVGIVMGSDSDLEIMSKAAQLLEKFGIDYDMTIVLEEQDKLENCYDKKIRKLFL